MSEVKLGAILSAVIRAKISATKRGKKFTEEHKANLSAAQPNSKKLSVLDLETGIETIYNSISEGGRITGLPTSSIRSNIKSNSQKPFLTPPPVGGG